MVWWRWKTVKIKHNSTYQTVYAHMSKFLEESNQRVKQGQIIGCWVNRKINRPHLHYEVINTEKK